ncbi:MAG TPA: ATP-binding cassette domain-containing protein [Thermaerobacter sp.]
MAGEPGTGGVVVEARGLAKRFGRITALEHVDLTIGPGIFGLLGPNGAGKTTLLRILATVLDPSEGTLAIAGHRLPRGKEAVRRLLGYVPQEFAVYRRLTGREFLDYVALLRGLEDPAVRRRRVQEVLERVNLLDAAHRLCGTYSGGMRRRLAVAQALLADPPFLVVDEPTAGLDPEEHLRFLDLLAELGRTRTIVFSTHVVADVAATCSRLAVLREGRLLFAGSAAELVSRVRGRVWEVRASETALQRLPGEVAVVKVRPAGAGVAARVVAGQNPGGLGVPAEPTLEDAYVGLVSGVLAEGEG